MITTLDEYMDQELEDLVKYVQARFDYPNFVCRKCFRNKKTDGIEPKCRKGACPLPKVSDGNDLAYRVYSFLSRSISRDYPGFFPGLIMSIFDLAMDQDEAFLFFERLATIHEVMIKHVKQNKDNPDS